MRAITLIKSRHYFQALELIAVAYTALIFSDFLIDRTFSTIFIFFADEMTVSITPREEVGFTEAYGPATFISEIRERILLST